MRVVFRADASYTIGTGHTMRCLSLAEELRRRGDEILFVSRAHPGHMHEAVKARGFSLAELEAPLASGPQIDETGPVRHAPWLGVTQSQDAADTLRAVADLAPLDWLIVDHYALDVEWERSLTSKTMRLAVIDDLADRNHEADLLTDATLGRESGEYSPLLPSRARLLLGPFYALLRTEFAESRAATLEARRKHVRPAGRLLVSLGGSEEAVTLTAVVLRSLTGCPLPRDLEIDVVLAATAPNVERIREIARELPWRTGVAVGVTDLSSRMQRADLAVGAAGVAAWERCCLGLPAVVISVAENQRRIAHSLAQTGAISWLGNLAAVSANPERIGGAVAALFGEPEQLRRMSEAASAVTDGKGVVRVAEALHD